MLKSQLGQMLFTSIALEETHDVPSTTSICTSYELIRSYFLCFKVLAPGYYLFSDSPILFSAGYASANNRSSSLPSPFLIVSKLT
jgi:hypothetical protein